MYVRNKDYAGVIGLIPQQTLLFESVSEYVSLVAWVDSRTQESQRGRNGLFWFGPIGALRPAADDPYTQEHPKTRGLQQSVKEKSLVGGLARC